MKKRVFVGLLVCVAAASVATVRAQSGLAGGLAARRGLAVAPQPLPGDLQPIAVDAVPRSVCTWWSIQRWPAFPAPMPYDWLADRPDLQRYLSPSLNAVFIDDSAVDYDAEAQQQAALTAAARSLGLASDTDNTETGGDGGPAFNGYDFPSNRLYLEITGLSSNLDLAFLLVHGTQPGEIYELMSKVQLTNAAWNPEQAVHAATNQDWTPATVPILDRTNSLYLWCRLWTTNDDNGNGLPDWWEWENFGNFNQAPNADYDADAISNLQEYLAGSDPNTIDFTFVSVSQYVSSRLAPVQIAVSRGVPSSMAVLVDPTNFAAAFWTGYGPNVIADLGAVEGWHQVWIGLRGRLPTSQQTWQTARVKLDVTPPLLVVTNPASAVLSRPTIQLQGYCPEALASLTYDLIPPVGAGDAVSNQMAFVMGQHYDTNSWEFSTNYWQAFDVPLGNGTNAITLHATDLAGNTTVTSLVYVLDLSANTNLPAIAIDWPQDGTRIGTDTFTWRGHVDDPTAQVYAQWVDASGTTNLVSGRVGREGDFWIDDLPVRDGTNMLTLVATSATGHSSATTIAPTRSEVDLIIDGVDAYTASGTVSDPDYTVWANGAQAEVVDLGYEIVWYVDLQLDLDHARLQVRAIPNSDNGGSGGGTNGASGPADLGNPTSPQATDAEAEWDPAGLTYVDSYRLQEHHGTGGPPYAYTMDAVYDWKERAGGTGRYTGPWGYPPGWIQYADAQYTWPPSRWPALADGILEWLPSGSGSEPVRSLGFGGGLYASIPAAYIFEHADFAYFSPDGSEVWNKQAQGGLMLVTGGRPGTTDSQLFLLTGRAETNAPELICLGGLGNLDTNGVRVAALPSHTQVPVTPRVKTGAKQYVYEAGAVPLEWVSECVADTPADRVRTNLGVGEQVKLRWNPWPRQWPVYSWQGGGWLTNWSTDGTVWMFTAPSNAATVTITATFPTGAKAQKTFQVVEPTGVHHAVAVGRQPYAIGQAGAGMRLTPYLGPTNVSFYRVQLMEVGNDASSVTGYFTNFTTADLTHKDPHGADVWFSIQQDNSWPSSYDRAKSAAYSPFSQGGWLGGGGFAWIIPAKWKIGSGQTNNVANGWDQTFTMDASGKMAVTKFNHTVTRQTTETYGIIVPDP